MSLYTLEDYFAAWQAAIYRCRTVLAQASAEPTLANIALGRDAVAEEEYAKTLYFRLCAEQEGET